MNKKQFLKLCETQDKNDLIKALQEGLNLNKQFKEGSWPLFLAIEQCKFHFASWCVELGANTDIVDKKGLSLVLKSYSVNNGPFFTHEFRQVGIKPFIHPKTIHAIDEYGNTALLLAINARVAKDVKLLLDNGANVDYIVPNDATTSRRGRSLLLLASFPIKVSEDDPESPSGVKVMKELIKYKPNPNIQDNYEKSVFPLATPLMKACMERNYAIANELLNLDNIDWSVKDKEGYSTFVFICKTNQENLILKAYQHCQTHVDFNEVRNSSYYESEINEQTKSLLEKLELEKTTLQSVIHTKIKKI